MHLAFLIDVQVVAGEREHVEPEALRRDALVELGWSMVDAERALAEVDESLPVEEQIRSALKKAA